MNIEIWNIQKTKQMEMKQFIFTIIIFGSQNFKKKTAIRNQISNIQKYFLYGENKPKNFNEIQVMRYKDGDYQLIINYALQMKDKDIKIINQIKNQDYHLFAPYYLKRQKELGWMQQKETSFSKSLLYVNKILVNLQEEIGIVIGQNTIS